MADAYTPSTVISNRYEQRLLMKYRVAALKLAMLSFHDEVYSEHELLSRAATLTQFIETGE